MGKTAAYLVPTPSLWLTKLCAQGGDVMEGYESLGGLSGRGGYRRPRVPLEKADKGATQRELSSDSSNGRQAISGKRSVLREVDRETEGGEAWDET